MDIAKCAGLNKIWRKRELFELLTGKTTAAATRWKVGDEEIEEVENITNITTALADYSKFGGKTGPKMRIYAGFRRGSYKNLVAVIRSNFVFTLG